MKKINRLLKNDDFKKVIQARKYFSNRSFTLYKLENELEHVRIGVSINKKYGKAHLRNLAKRQTRMMCEEIIPVNFNYDLVLIIKNEYINLDFKENKENLEYLFKKIKDEEK